MKSPLSQAQAGVYYACETSVSDEYNYQNPVLFSLPEDADLRRLQQAVQDALCAHPYLLSHVIVNDEGTPEVESGEVTASVPLREAAPRMALRVPRPRCPHIEGKARHIELRGWHPARLGRCVRRGVQGSLATRNIQDAKLASQTKPPRITAGRLL